MNRGLRIACSRRELLRAGMYGVGMSAALPGFLRRWSAAETFDVLAGGESRHPERVLVVVELTGGNDGLNTVVPYADDAYHKARPRLGLAASEVLKIDERFGFHEACQGLHSLYRDGKLAIVHGCGYPDPNLSHFTAMEWWHTAVPHGNEPFGWLGRLADTAHPEPAENYIVNIGSKQMRAVASSRHSPVVFRDPRRFRRIGTKAEEKVFNEFGTVYPTANPSLAFVNTVSRTATRGAAAVRGACAEYKTAVDYGSDNDLVLGLKRVAAMLQAGMPTRIFYLNMGGFDTHASQATLHNLQLIYFCDAVRGFMEDLQRLGRAEDVAVLVFTEFGRRVEENASRGTDHGTATPMFIVGSRVKGGLYGEHPSLTDLDDGNLRMTCDFRRVYATMIQGWMGSDKSDAILKGPYPALDVFA